MKYVEEINDMAVLRRRELLWKAMLSETPAATFFQSLDWLEAYWNHFGQGQRLRVLFGWDGDRPLGILPLVVLHESTQVGSVRVLTYPLHDWGTFYGPIGPDPEAMLRLALRHIRQTPRDWDLFDLRWVDDRGRDQGQTGQTFVEAGFTPHRQAWDRAAVLDMSGSWTDYWQSRSPKWRESIRRYRRRLEEAGKVEFLRYRPRGDDVGDANPRWDLFDDCLEVARASWQGDSTDGSTLCHESVAPFLRDAHLAAVKNGSLDLCLLKLNGRPIAFVYNYCHNGRVFGLRMGFDPAAADLGPGKVLQYLMFKDSFERGDSHFDLGVGSLDVKRHWFTSVATSYRLTCYSPTSFRAQLLRLKRLYVHRRFGDAYLAGGRSVKQAAG